MNEARKARGVALPEGVSASSLFHKVLSDAVAQFPEALADAAVPSSPAQFKQEYGSVLARFEAARCASEARVEIARFLLRATQRTLTFVDAQDHAEPLLAHLARPAPEVELTTTRLHGNPGLPVAVPFEGRWLRGREVLDWVQSLLDEHQVTTGVRDAIAWLVQHADAQGGALNLEGQRFVLMGAGAELAPTQLLLRGGAEVLWIDLADPARVLEADEELAGALTHSPAASNLLEQPLEIAAAIRQFAAGAPVNVGMYAYAGGEIQEWRLGAAMNAILSNLPPEVVGAVSLLVSPTSPGTLAEETLAAGVARLESAPLWQRAAAAIGLIKKPGHYRAKSQSVALATVSMQGLSYQAAQYISKLSAAECYATFGNRLHDDAPGTPVTVSCNVAGITRTRSLSHPLFEAAFAGAAHFGVRIFDAETTRCLNSLLMLHDVLNPDAPAAAAAFTSPRERAARVHTEQVHGGVYGLPFALEGVIRLAALLGMARHPSVLRKTPKAKAQGPVLPPPPTVGAAPARQRPASQPSVSAE